MVDAQPSLRAAEGLSGSEVAAYLLTKGWAASPSRVKGFSIFSKKIGSSENSVEIILPVTRGFDEEQRRIADALRTIGAIEGRSVSAVADEIRLSDHVEQDNAPSVHKQQQPRHRDIKPANIVAAIEASLKEGRNWSAMATEVYHLYWYAADFERPDSRDIFDSRRITSDRAVMSAVMKISYRERLETFANFVILYRGRSDQVQEVSGIAFENEDKGTLNFLGWEKRVRNIFYMVLHSKTVKKSEPGIALMFRGLASGSAVAQKVGVLKAAGMASSEDISSTTGVLRESDVKRDIDVFGNELGSSIQLEELSEWLVNP
jgi:hypothetical protein